jgi:hypothetical protein
LKLLKGTGIAPVAVLPLGIHVQFIAAEPLHLYVLICFLPPAQ